MNFVLKILLGAIFLVLAYLIGGNQKAGLQNASIVVFATVFLVDGGSFIVSNRGWLELVTKMAWLSLPGKKIRFSMSYQYIIKIDDKYLLVKNANPHWNWYQHVGGKYKRLEETQHILKKFGATDDPKMKTAGLKKGDMAVFIPAKNGIKFLDWFDKHEDREISHWREFYEELLGGKASERVLSKDNFPYINYRFIKSVRTPLKKTPIESGWDCWELLQYDVLELIPTPEQEKELRRLKEKGDTDYIKWASRDLIDNLGHDNRKQESIYKIGPHAKWVMNGKWSKE